MNLVEERGKSLKLYRRAFSEQDKQQVRINKHKNI